MNTGVILISAARYLHAVHDIQLETDGELPPEELLHQAKMLQDPQLFEYWQDYRDSLDGGAEGTATN